MSTYSAVLTLELCIEYHCTSMLNWGHACADVRQTALSAARAECQKTGLLDETPQRSAGLRAVHALLHRTPCRDGIDMETWNSLVPRPQVCQS